MSVAPPRSDGLLTKQYLFACQATFDWLGSDRSCNGGVLPPEGIKDLFYETRVLSGREYTVTRFAERSARGRRRPCDAGLHREGKALPERSVGASPGAAYATSREAPLIAVLYRDRMIYAFGRELRRALHDPAAIEGIADADLAVQVSRAIAAPPTTAAWITTAKWRKRDQCRRTRQVESDRRVGAVTSLLKERGLVEQAKGKVRRKSRHFVATTLEERRALAMEFTRDLHQGAARQGESSPGARGRDASRAITTLHIERERLPGVLPKAREGGAGTGGRVRRRCRCRHGVPERLIVGTPV